MLKRAIDGIQVDQNGSDCNGEPQRKRANYDSSVEANETTIGDFHIETHFEKSPEKRQDLVNSCPMLSELLEKKPNEKEYLFDHFLEYSDNNPMVGLSGHKENVDGKPPLDDNSEPSRPNSNDVQLPQMVLNPKAVLKAPNSVNNPPDVVPISDQRLRQYPSGMRACEAPDQSTPLQILESPIMEKSVCTLPQETVSATPQPECCVIEKLLKRFHCGVSPLAESEILTYTHSGRPTPAIPSLGLTSYLYGYDWWITGCPSLQRLYCWACLLFRNTSIRKRIDTWVRDGFKAWNQLGPAVFRHAQTADHKAAVRRYYSTVHVMQDWSTNLIQASDVMAGPSITATKNQPALQPTKIQHFPQEYRTGLLNSGSCLDNPAQELFYSAQTLPSDSSNSPSITPDELNQGTPMVSTAAHNENTGAYHPLSSQREIYDLTQSEGFNRSSREAAGKQALTFSGPTDSSKRYLEAKSQYFKLIEELEMKALPSTQSPKTPSPPQAPPPTPEIRPLPEIDIGTLQIKCFPNGVFNGNEVLRQQIIATGRPTPKMPGFAQLGNDGVMKYFDMSYYDEFPWMCGSAELNRIYCWPCLVLSNHQNNTTWNTAGFGSLLDLPLAAKIHSMNQIHLELTINLKVAEEVIKSRNSKISLVNRNTIVRKKRSIMKYLIDAVCFKKKLMNNNETGHEDFEYFLKFFSNWDVELRSLLDTKSENYLPDFTPNVIRNYSHVITKALKIILKRKIAEEVENAIYVSFILKTVQITRTALILRYTSNTGEVHERFYKFIKISFGRPQTLLKKILDVVRDLKCSAKFVGISYDGGVLSPDQMEAFNSNLRTTLTAAYFFHRCEDNFRDTLQQSLSRTPYCRSFFNVLTKLGAFLQGSPQALHFIKSFENGTGNVTQNPESYWNLKSGIIFTVRDHFLAIIKFMDHVARTSSTPGPWSNYEISQCVEFSIFLRLRETRLLLVLLSTVYLTLRNLTVALQSGFDATYRKNAANEAYSAILDIRICRFGDMFKLAEGMGFNDLSIPNEERVKLTTIFDDTLNWILGFIKSHTKYINIWAYFDFATNKIDNPVARARLHSTQLLMDLRECFPFFDCQKLGSALIFAYNHKRFRNKSAHEIIQVMIEWDLKSVLPELYHFLLVVLTVPLSSAHVNTPISDKIASYFEGKTELKSGDALFYVEKDLLTAAKNEENFYNDVIRIVAELKRTNEFIEIDKSGKLVEQLKFMGIENNDVIEID